jgi:hypothetical protein
MPEAFKSDAEFQNDAETKLPPLTRDQLTEYLNNRLAHANDETAPDWDDDRAYKQTRATGLRILLNRLSRHPGEPAEVVPLLREEFDNPEGPYKGQTTQEVGAEIDRLLETLEHMVTDPRIAASEVGTAQAIQQTTEATAQAAAEPSQDERVKTARQNVETARNTDGTLTPEAIAAARASLPNITPSPGERHPKS